VLLSLINVGLSVGNRQNKLLRKHADELCANFAQRCGISPEMLEAQIPTIRKLRLLADPPAKPSGSLPHCSAIDSDARGTALVIEAPRCSVLSAFRSVLLCRTGD
jgi:hypothetical protein